MTVYPSAEGFDNDTWAVHLMRADYSLWLCIGHQG